MNKLIRRVGGSIAGLLGSAAAMAAGPDISSLTAAADFSSVGTGILAVGAGMAVVYVTFKAGKLVISAIKGF